MATFQTQTPAQQAATFAAAGLNSAQQAAVISGKPLASDAAGEQKAFAALGGGSSTPVKTAPVVAPAPVTNNPPVVTAPQNSDPTKIAPAVSSNSGGGSTDNTVYSGVDVTGTQTGTPGTAYKYKIVNGQVVVQPATPAAPTTPALTPPAPAPTEEELFAKYQGQAQGLIDSIQGAFDSSIASINNNAAKDQEDAGAMAAANGLLGSSAAIANAGSIRSKSDTDIAAVNTQRATAVAGVLQQLQSLAVNEADTAKTTFDTESQNYLNNVEQQKTDASNIISKLGAAEVNWDTFKTTPEYTQVVNMLGGDTNYADALYALSKPAGNVDATLSKIIGNTYYQVTRDPVTGKMSSSSFQLPYGMPPNWTTTKIGTNGQFFQDPNDASNTFTLTTNPFTGGITATGTGAGAQWASDYNAQSGGGTTTPPPNNNTNTTGAGTASTTISSILGIDPTTPIADVMSGSGIGALTAAIIKNEGGSPQGVSNNPGNVKFAGLPGQTDSGVKATDGGTFASYATPADGEKAIADVVNSIATKQGSAATLQSVINSYTNTGSNSSSTTTSASGLDPKEYGKLATVAGFNPTTPGIDQDALKYLQGYLSGTQPTAASIGISTRTGSGGVFDTVSQRAKDVYFKATGQNLPNISVLKDNLGLVSKNNALLNNLSVQTGTITKNFGLNLDNLTKNNVNNAPPAINGIADYLAQAAGSTSVAQYLTQNATLQQEIGGLLSIKNASGVTVADKIAAGDLLPTDLSIDQQKQILDTFFKEARNQQQAIGSATERLYQQTDPLGLDPQNPVNTPGYQEFTAIPGFQNNYDGTWSAPDGSTWSVGADGNPVQQ